VLILTDHPEEPVGLGFIEDLEEGWRWQNAEPVGPECQVLGWMPAEALEALPLV
jgi:hypothetical protein